MKTVTQSRNRREGGYLGCYTSVYDVPYSPGRRRHHRKGKWHWPTLRDEKKHRWSSI